MTCAESRLLWHWIGVGWSGACNPQERLRPKKSDVFQHRFMVSIAEPGHVFGDARGGTTLPGQTALTFSWALLAPGGDPCDQLWSRGEFYTWICGHHPPEGNEQSSPVKEIPVDCTNSHHSGGPGFHTASLGAPRSTGNTTEQNSQDSGVLSLC